MSGESRVDVEIGAHAEGLEQGFSRAQNSVEENVAKMRESLDQLSESGKAIGERFEQLFSIITTGGAFAEVIEKTNQWAEGIEQLSVRMGISRDQAADMVTAFKLVGLGQEDASHALGGMQRQLRANEQAFNDLGVTTREYAGGPLRDSQALMEDALAKITEYKAGTDQMVVAQTLFGRSVAESLPQLLQLRDKMEEARKVNLELGLTAKGAAAGAVDQLEKWHESTGLAGAALTALSSTIGQEVMPIFEDLMVEFKDAAVEYMPNVKVGAKLVAEALLFLKDGAEFVAAAFVGMGKIIGDSVAGAVDVVNHLMHGDFKGAMAAAGEAGHQVGDDWQEMQDKIQKADEATYAKIQALWSEDPHKGTGEGDEKPKGGKAAPDKSGQVDQLKELTAAFDEMKLARAAALDPATGEDELAFWQRVLDSAKEYGLTQDQIGQVRHNLLQAMATDAKEVQAAEDAAAQEELDRATANIKMQAEASRQSIGQALQQSQMRVATGQETHAQLLQDEIAYAQMKGQVDAEEFQRLADLYDVDQKEHAAYLLQKQKAEEKVAQEIAKIQAAAAAQETAVYQKLAAGLANQFTSAFDGLIKGTESWGQAGRRLEQSLAEDGIKAIEKMTAKWVEDELLKITLGKAYQETQVQADAAKAASGAYAATVGIPYVGPILAPAAAATAYVAVMAFAEQGYDIPAGVNPITQLHQREMVLPAEHADTIRSLGKGGAGAGGAPTFHIHAQDSADVETFIRRHGSKLADVVAGRMSGSNFRPRGFV